MWRRARSQVLAGAARSPSTVRSWPRSDSTRPNPTGRRWPPTRPGPASTSAPHASRSPSFSAKRQPDGPAPSPAPTGPGRAASSPSRSVECRLALPPKNSSSGRDAAAGSVADSGDRSRAAKAIRSACRLGASCPPAGSPAHDHAQRCQRGHRGGGVRARARRARSRASGSRPRRSRAAPSTSRGPPPGRGRAGGVAGVAEVAQRRQQLSRSVSSGAQRPPAAGSAQLRGRPVGQPGEVGGVRGRAAVERPRSASRSVPYSRNGLQHPEPGAVARLLGDQERLVDRASSRSSDVGSAPRSAHTAGRARAVAPGAEHARSARRPRARRGRAGPSSTRRRRAACGAAASPCGCRRSAAGTGRSAGRRPRRPSAPAAAPRPARWPAAARPAGGTISTTGADGGRSTPTARHAPQLRPVRQQPRRPGRRAPSAVGVPGGQRQRRQRVQRLAVDRRAARGWSRAPAPAGSRPSDVGDQRGRRVDHVLAVVHHEQAVASASVSSTRARASAPRPLATALLHQPRRRAHPAVQAGQRDVVRRRSPAPAPRTRRRPASLGEDGGDLGGQPGLPGAPGADDRHQPGRGRSIQPPAHRPGLRSRPTKLVTCRAQVRPRRLVASWLRSTSRCLACKAPRVGAQGVGQKLAGRAGRRPAPRRDDPPAKASSAERRGPRAPG